MTAGIALILIPTAPMNPKIWMTTRATTETATAPIQALTRTTEKAVKMASKMQPWATASQNLKLTV
jgi:hypothetical protein